MENVNLEINNEEKIFNFKGKLDSSNSDSVMNYISNNINQEDHVIFNFSQLDYISSTGLRVVLSIAKRVAEFKVIEVSSEVYNIFEMTGLNQMLTIKKTLRELSIEGKELIGEGYMGKVYRLDPDTIIKVYLRYSSMEDIERETNLAKKAFILGIPTAIPFDVVKVKEGGYGSIFELLKSESFNKLFKLHPENTDKYIQMYINLLKTVITTEIHDDSLPHKKDEAKEWVNILRKNKAFDEKMLQKLDNLIETIPERNTLIHGDLHIKNIMMQGEEPLLIDMDTLGVGHPIFELSAIYLTYIGYPETSAPGNIKEFLGIDDELANRLWIESVTAIYGNRGQQGLSEAIGKIKLYAYIWFAAKTLIFEPDNKSRYKFCLNKIVELSNIYDTLCF